MTNGWVVVANVGKPVAGLFNHHCLFKPTKHEFSWITLSTFELSSLLQKKKNSLTILPPILPHDHSSPHGLMVQDGNGAAQGVLRQGGGLLDSLHGHLQGERHPPLHQPPVPAAGPRKSSGLPAESRRWWWGAAWIMMWG